MHHIFSLTPNKLDRNKPLRAKRIESRMHKLIAKPFDLRGIERVNKRDGIHDQSRGGEPQYYNLQAYIKIRVFKSA